MTLTKKTYQVPQVDIMDVQAAKVILYSFGIGGPGSGKIAE
jgi:hypothetical protein